MNRTVSLGIIVHTIVLFTFTVIGFKDYNTIFQFVKIIFGAGGEYTYSFTENMRLMLIIFTRNSATSALMLAAGPILSFMSFLSIAFNGYIAGGVIGYRHIVDGYSIFKTLAYIIPHGIIEISTLLYVSGLSFDLAVTVFVNREKLSDKLRKYFRNYFKFVIPLLLLAAFIEAFITPLIGSMV